jgi:hypothetical protein
MATETDPLQYVDCSQSLEAMYYCRSRRVLLPPKEVPQGESLSAGESGE